MDESAISPSQRCKTVHLVRHAEGTHNLEGDKDERAYADWKHFDAQLTPLGWKQVEDLHEHVKSSGLSRKLDLVVVSPLLRAMQTAVGVFGSCDRSAVGSTNCPPFLAVEKCRERIGYNPCDKRRSVREYKKLFPAIDFSLIEIDDDILWSDIREKIEDLEARVEEFIKWLWTRQEKEIAIVTHSVFLDHLLRKFVPQSHPLEKEICKTFANCELRSLTLTNTGMIE